MSSPTRDSSYRTACTFVGVCGRIVVARPRDYYADWLGAQPVIDDVTPTWNGAPGMRVLAVAATSSGRRLGSMTWGLVPSWSSDPAAGPRPINARVESLLDRAVFAEALARRRCIVPVDGFYEWQAGGAPKQPFFVASPDGSPLALAGLWDRWVGGDGQALVTCAVVTAAASADVAPLHDRMPVSLHRDAWDRWLDPANTDVAGLLGLLGAPAVKLVARPASPLVNSTKNDGPDLLVSPGPAPPQPQALQLPL